MVFPENTINLRKNPTQTLGFRAKRDTISQIKTCKTFI